MAAPGFMSIEPALVAQIKGAMPANVHVLTAQDLAKVTERAQRVPAVHVVYAGPDISESNGMVQVSERWLPVVAVRHSGDQVGGQKAREDAGPILDAVWEALNGWKPADDWKALQPVSPPGAGFYNGFGYYPLAWNARARKIQNPCPIQT
jgi:hypothetical protein